MALRPLPFIVFCFLSLSLHAALQDRLCVSADGQSGDDDALQYSFCRCGHQK